MTQLSQEKLRDLSEYTTAMVAEGMSLEEIKGAIVRQGIDEATAQMFLEAYCEELNRERKGIRHTLLHGGLRNLSAGGIVVFLLAIAAVVVGIMAFSVTGYAMAAVGLLSGVAVFVIGWGVLRLLGVSMVRSEE